MTVTDIVTDIESYLSGDGMADYVSLIEGLGIVGRIGSIVIGILVVMIVVGMPVVVAIEVFYINFPIVQNGYDEIYHRLKGKANRIFGLVIRDARKALELSHTTKNGESVNYIYLRIKIKAVFIAVFIVAMVLGPGTFILAQALKLMQGIIEALG